MKKGKIIPLVILAVVLILAAGLYLFLRPWTQHLGADWPGNVYALHERTGTLVLFGEPEMNHKYVDYLAGSPTPEKWYSTMAVELGESRSQVKQLVISEGITHVLGTLVPDFENLQEVWIPASVVRIGARGNYPSGDVFGNAYVKTIYFCGDAPQLDSLTFRNMHTDPKDLTIVHKPGAKGFDTEPWQQFHVVEQDFSCPHSRLGWLTTAYYAAKSLILTFTGEYLPTEG